MTKSKPVGILRVLLDLLDIVFGFSVVEDQVLDDFLDSLGRVFEDSGPLLNALDIGFNTFAVLQILGEILNDLEHHLDAFQDIREVSFLKISDRLFDFFFET